MANNVSLEFQLATGDWAAYAGNHSFSICSATEVTVGKYGATSAESMVAPPYVRLYIRRVEALYFTVKKSTQLGPLEAVYPGYVGFPSGFVLVGWTPLTLKFVVV
jgi:hypothetical protein